MKKSLIGILLILCLVLAGCGMSDSTPDTAKESTVESKKTSTIEESETTETVAKPTVDSKTLDFVDAFNATSEVKLVFAEDFTPSDKSSSHYRTEFRLSAYSDAIGKSFTYGETVVDIVCKQSWSDRITIRIYMDGATLEQCVQMVKYASSIMDPDINDADIQKAIDHINETKTANGYYYADLGLQLSGNETKGYEFMLKMSND